MTQRATRPVHLRVYTEFSLLEGMVRTESISTEAHAPALAITDKHNMFGVPKFNARCLEQGVQPITGCELHVGREGDCLYVYVQSKQGYSNLCQIISNSDTECIENLELLIKHNGGLLVMLGERSPSEWAHKLHGVFGDRLGIALSKYEVGEKYATPPELLRVAKNLRIPLIASNLAYFGSEDNYEAHDALRCIATREHVDSAGRKRLSQYHRLLTEDEWQMLFHDSPQAVQNTVLWAQKCHFVLENKKQSAPTTEEDVRTLREMSRVGLERRIANIQDKEPYLKQAEYELGVIRQLGLEGYFLRVADYVVWAKNQGIPTSCRGSGAGSVVAWSINITDIDPLRFSLVFERFLNPERVSMADFDIDFCQQRRHEVIEYIQNKYGKEYVAHIGTFGTLQARAVLRDLGRVIGLRYSEVDELCKLIPFHPLFPVNLKTARETQSELDRLIKANSNIERLWRLSERLEGLPRHISTHAAGVIISDTKLEECVPLYNDPAAKMKVTQYDMYALERAGFVKFDILGLAGLTMINEVVNLLRAHDIDVDLESIDICDPVVFRYLSTGNSYGVFQLDSIGIREILKQLRPKKLEDLIALNALYRPGPVSNIPKYIEYRANPELIPYLYPELKRVLGETHGIIVYQEQVLQIAQVIAGYSLAKADLLRRAIGKKIESEMQRHRSIFIEAATELHGSRSKAEELFDLIEKFAQYGFVKAHATCYAVVMYRMAYLKAHYTIYFICVGLTTDGQHQEKLIQWKREADREEIRILPPCVSCSASSFAIEDGAIRYGLSALKNVGEGFAQRLCKERALREFADPWDFARRTEVNKQALESLIKSGAMDVFGVSRGILMHNINYLLHQPELFAPSFESAEDFSDTVRYRSLFESMGIYLRDHPLQRLPLRALGFSKCCDSLYDGARIAGVVLHIDRRRMKSGSIYGILSVSDPSGIAEVSVFSDLWTVVQKRIKVNQVVWCKVRTGRGIAAQSIGLVDDGLDVGCVRCVFDDLPDTGVLQALKELPRGSTRLMLEHGGERWHLGNIRLTFGVVRKLVDAEGMRWEVGG